MLTSIILGHMGLGDHLYTNGMIRYYLQTYEVNLLCKKIYHNTLKDLYSDYSEKINIISFDSDDKAINFFNNFNHQYDLKITFGDFAPNFMKDSNTFDESFYKQLNIPYEYRWSMFKAPIINSIKSPEKKYIFIHDDPERNLCINDKYLNNSYLFYKPQKNTNFFSYHEILLNAEEIHCMDSSFAAYVDHIPEFKSKKKILHRYIRKYSRNPFMKNNWEFIYE